MMPDREASLVFHNRAATFIWGFSAVWLGMLGMMTYLLYRDGLPRGYSQELSLAVAGVFWVAGIGLAVYAASRSIYSVNVYKDSRITVTRRYPHRVVHELIPKSRVQPAVVIESDSDSGLYYFARAAISGGKPIDIVEGHVRELCEQACVRFNETLFGSPSTHHADHAAGEDSPGRSRA